MERQVQSAFVIQILSKASYSKDMHGVGKFKN